MTLHLIQLRPDMPRLMRWAASKRRVATRRTMTWATRLHAVLNACFQGLSPAPFALLRDSGAAHRWPSAPATTEDWRTQGMLLAYSAQ